MFLRYFYLINFEFLKLGDLLDSVMLNYLLFRDLTCFSLKRSEKTSYASIEFYLCPLNQI